MLRSKHSYIYVWRPDIANECNLGVDRGCPWVLDRGRQFCSKNLLLGAPKDEAARQLEVWLGLGNFNTHAFHENLQKDCN